MTTSMTAEAPHVLPMPSTGPVECQPWCVTGDGHPGCVFRVDQWCGTAELRIDTSLYPMIDQSRYVEGEGWTAGPDFILVHAQQRADDRYPRIVIRRETEGPLVEWEFTCAEAHDLIEALQLVLGQVEATQ